MKIFKFDFYINPGTKIPLDNKSRHFGARIPVSPGILCDTNSVQSRSSIWRMFLIVSSFYTEFYFLCPVGPVLGQKSAGRAGLGQNFAGLSRIAVPPDKWERYKKCGTVLPRPLPITDYDHANVKKFLLNQGLKILAGLKVRHCKLDNKKGVLWVPFLCEAGCVFVDNSSNSFLIVFWLWKMMKTNSARRNQTKR